MPSAATCIGLTYVDTAHPLPGCEADAFRYSFLASRLMGLSESAVTLASDVTDPSLTASPETILDLLEDRVYQAQPGDRLLFALCGLGGNCVVNQDDFKSKATDSDMLFLVGGDGQVLRVTGMIQVLSELPENVTMYLVLDSSRSGSVPDLDLSAVDGSVVYLSASASQSTFPYQPDMPRSCSPTHDPNPSAIEFTFTAPSRENSLNVSALSRHDPLDSLAPSPFSIAGRLSPLSRGDTDNTLSSIVLDAVQSRPGIRWDELMQHIAMEARDEFVVNVVTNDCALLDGPTFGLDLSRIPLHSTRSSSDSECEDGPESHHCSSAHGSDAGSVHGHGGGFRPSVWVTSLGCDDDGADLLVEQGSLCIKHEMERAPMDWLQAVSGADVAGGGRGGGGKGSDAGSVHSLVGDWGWMAGV